MSSSFSRRMGRQEMGPTSSTYSQDATLQWFAVSVKMHAEWAVARMLNTNGYEEFVPTYKETRQWSDRRKEIDVPLFTRYVFCRFDGRFRSPILKTPGVLSIVGTPAGPIPIEPYEIDALKQMSRSGLACQRWPFFQQGQRVRVRRGALSGLEGLLVQSKKGSKLVLSVTLLQRSVAIEIDAARVECLPNRHC
jgi:transcription antitermination factor NusG